MENIEIIDASNSKPLKKLKNWVVDINKIEKLI